VKYFGAEARGKSLMGRWSNTRRSAGKRLFAGVPYNFGQSVLITGSWFNE
jgi:hypothetical protein